MSSRPRALSQSQEGSTDSISMKGSTGLESRDVTMSVYKKEDNGTWYVMTWYTNWKGEHKQKCKRGFATKREAQEWERTFQLQNAANMDMSFKAFTELYEKDIRPRLKENTWLNQSFFTEDVDKLHYHELCICFLLDVADTGLQKRGGKFTLHERQHMHVFEWLDVGRLKTEIYNLPESFTIRTEFE